MVNFYRDVYCLLGLPFDAVDMATVVLRVQQAARERQPCFLSTPNLNFLAGCQTDSQFRNSIIHSDLSIPDGMPLVWIARLLGMPLRERISGSSVFEALRSSTAEPMSIFFLGGQEGVAKAACQRLNAYSSGLKCVGFEFPGFGSVEEMSSDESIAKINASGADFLAVSLGAKKGQTWITRNRARISVPVIGYLGAVLNFAAGTLKRAPGWMQRSGLEWLWRIKEEPRLWRRYFYDGLTLLRLLITRVVPFVWFMYRHKPTRKELDSAAIEVQREGNKLVIRLRGAWVQNNLRPIRESFSNIALSGKDLQIDLEAVSYVDAAFLGLAMLLQGHQKQHGKQFLMISAQEPVRRAIKYCCAEYLSLKPT